MYNYTFKEIFDLLKINNVAKEIGINSIDFEKSLKRDAFSEAEKVRIVNYLIEVFDIVNRNQF